MGKYINKLITFKSIVCNDKIYINNMIKLK